MGKTVVAFGDCHIPKENPVALSILMKAIAEINPHVVISLGDLIDASQFSEHPPSWDEDEPSDYFDDLAKANDLLDFCLQHTRERVVCLAGNHEDRVSRWAAKNKTGAKLYNAINPQTVLSRGRKRFTYVPYSNKGDCYPHFKINSRIVAVHGITYAKHAARTHLDLAQGKSIIYGHTHRQDYVRCQNLWGKGAVRAVGAGCICGTVPAWGVGRRFEWTNGFLVLYLGRSDDTIQLIEIQGNRAIISSDKTEITA